MRSFICILLCLASAPMAGAEEFWQLDASVERAERAAADLYADYPRVETPQSPDPDPRPSPGEEPARAEAGRGQTRVLETPAAEMAQIFAKLPERQPDASIRLLTRDGAAISQGPTGESLDARMIAFIARHEAGAASYDSVWHGNRVPLPKPRLTQMSLCEVMDWQARARKVQRSTAVGLFQIISGTLRDVVGDLGIACDTPFDADLQHRLGLALLDGRGWAAFKRGEMSVADFAYSLAGEWAAFPAPYGKNRGRSRYHGIAGNKHQIGLDAYLGFLRELREAGSVQTADLRR